MISSIGAPANALASISGMEGPAPAFPAMAALSGPDPSLLDNSLLESFFTSHGNSLIEINYNRKRYLILDNYIAHFYIKFAIEQNKE